MLLVAKSRIRLLEPHRQRRIEEHKHESEWGR